MNKLTTFQKQTLKRVIEQCIHLSDQSPNVAGILGISAKDR